MNEEQTTVIQSLLNSPSRRDPLYFCARVNELWKGTFYNITPGVIATISWRNLLVELAEQTKKIDKPPILVNNRELLRLILNDYSNLRTQFMKDRHQNDITWKDVNQSANELKKLNPPLPILEKFWNNWFGSSIGVLLEVLYCLHKWDVIMEPQEL